jgi:hypothetical protein
MKSIVAVILAGISLSACSTVVREGASPGIRVSEASPRMNTVGILDKSLADWNAQASWFGGDSEGDRMSKIAVERTGGRATPTNNLEAWAMLRNRTDHPLQLEGRVTFFDASETPAEGPTGWQRIFLPPQGTATYSGSSSKPLSVVRYYYIEVREGR